MSKELKGFIETTNQHTRQFRTYVSTTGDDSMNAAEAFNLIGGLPESHIDLGDGRELCIQEWKPESNEHTCTKFLKITIVGFIRLKEVGDK